MVIVKIQWKAAYLGMGDGRVYRDTVVVDSMEALEDDLESIFETHSTVYNYCEETEHETEELKIVATMEIEEDFTPFTQN